MTKKTKKSTQVALGGLSSALCLIIMFLTGVIPFSEYAFPALAGIILIAVAHENGFKTAMMVYTVVSILAIFIVPIKESVLLFVMFFGYYPLLQRKLNKISFKPIQYLLKFLIFNVAILAVYAIVVNVLGLTEIMEEFGSFGKYSALVLLVFGNIFFGVYDFTVDNMDYVYLNWFRPKFLKRVGG